MLKFCLKLGDLLIQLHPLLPKLIKTDAALIPSILSLSFTEAPPLNQLSTLELRTNEAVLLSFLQ
ncbi:hypothetical protein SAMN02927895_05036 [Belnapia rosea]|nr:hypothetical protein SAMN02927895_05036 [Belnapia rosea]